MKKKKTSYTCYDDMLCDYYGGRRPSRQRRRSVAKSFDNGEVIPGKDTEPFQEYVVAASVDKDGDIFEEYVVQASVIKSSNPSPHEEYIVYSSSYEDEITYSPVSHNQDLQTNVLDPLSSSKSAPETITPDRPSYTPTYTPSYTPSYTPGVPETPESPDTAGLIEDLKQMRGAEAKPADNSGSLSSKEEDIVNDLQAILSGKKVYDPTAKKTVNRDDLGKQQSVNTPPPPAGNDPSVKNEHAIFDRIAQNMQYANAYNLGTIQVDTEELNNRFNDFECTPPKPLKRPASPPPSSPPPANVSKEESFDPTEFLNDLENMHKQSNPAPSTQMSPPAASDADSTLNQE
ncbi:hypothetical protein SAMN05518672_103459 [Chitinophaga sp. CF118]|uniref:hypothetical protein n=1 Tax=Chitinophaga sp. CF118 TaxID=1884367 RepID=UPI0008E501EB|nr:hypothetical protein [Chitinophaga sp. CF118]SFD84100.1 hypothetical protein SAMN05518672_103459 [Chitinophaga sp. CF118]